MSWQRRIEQYLDGFPLSASSRPQEATQLQRHLILDFGSGQDIPDFVES